MSRWIPVSERLPKETEYLEIYLVSIGDWVGLGYFAKGKFWRNAFFQDGLHSFDFPVEAWMPMPEPYTKENE